MNGVLAGADLSAEQADRLVGETADGAAAPTQIAAIAVALGCHPGRSPRRHRRPGAGRRARRHRPGPRRRTDHREHAARRALPRRTGGTWCSGARDAERLRETAAVCAGHGIGAVFPLAFPPAAPVGGATCRCRGGGWCRGRRSRRSVPSP
ncbi:hypothetical protein [Kitasatospora cineracea]|uniref:hypothetical protein n=1 Tax=Kitasatospora cineracea TaxID=88074 RepID=UPI000F4F7CA4